MGAAVQWWLLLLLIGAGFFPLSNYIFEDFSDGGWLFSKMIGLLVSAWALWVLTVAGITPFRQMTAVASIVILSAVNYAVLFLRGHFRGNRPARALDYRLMIAEEAMFFGFLMLAVYVIGFDPEAYGTEKYMDYAFMTSMSRSTKLPFEDPWLSGNAVNYYYGGQYIAAFLMKASGIGPGISYNLMRGLVTAMSFMLPFSLVFRMVSDREDVEFQVWKKAEQPAFPAGENAEERQSPSGENTGDVRTEEDAEPVGSRNAGKSDGFIDVLPWFGGILAGAAVAFAGNGHYVIFGIFKAIAAKIQGVSYSYWFPNSTRYIGYDPDLPDKAIHEFPAYSSILGDLHAHYVNLIFTVTVVAIVYAWAKRREKTGPSRFPWIDPWIVLVGLFIGVFQWTNAADFAVYYVVCGSIFFFENVRLYRRRPVRFLVTMLGQAAVIFGIAYAAALPFTMSFDSFTEGILRTHSHSLIWQLAILWGLPVAVLAGFVVKLVSQRKREPMAQPDLSALLFGLCAAGLVLLPELVYVKDIYGEDHYRANTMFKLTYAAFILFGIMMGYVLSTAFLKATVKAACGEENGVPAGESERSSGEENSEQTGESERSTGDENSAPAGESERSNGDENSTPAGESERSNGGGGGQSAERLTGDALSGKFGRTAAAIGIIFLALTCGYTFTGVASWFGNVLDPSLRVGTDASVFIYERFPGDFGAISWLNNNVESQPTILEAPGDSYSDYGRVSVVTGLPTVAGWYVHEWLWRGGHECMDERLPDIQTIYTSGDAGLVRSKVRKYGISYIYVGDLEREKYPDLRDDVLRGLGELVYEDEGAYIVKISET